MPRRVKKLESKIDDLVKESIHLLKAQLEETSSTGPTDFSEQVERILCGRNGLEKLRLGLDTDLRWLDGEEKEVVARKEREVLDELNDMDELNELK